MLCGASWPFRPNLNTAQAIERLRYGIHMGLKEVVFSGGEVTLRRDLPKLINYARDLGYSSIVLLTNGRRLADLNLLRNLIRAGITSIGSSLHGHTAEIHEQITRAPRSFEQAIAGIKAVRVNFPELPLSVNCVLNRVNYRYMREIVHLLVKANVRLVQITNVVPVGKAVGTYLHPETPRISETLPYIHDSIDYFVQQYKPLSNSSITLAFFPFCILGDLMRFSGETSQSMSYFVSEIGEFVLIDDEISQQNLKIKRPECALCRFEKYCDGIWKEYIIAKGWNEFNPINEYDPEQIISTPRNQQSVQGF
jgi:MoaA/NifB/PqqE/SkfB family radical SAM enzyme